MRQERTGDLLLELQKSNLGRTDQSMRFAWSEAAQMFVGREVAAATALDVAHRDHDEQSAILAALQACADSEPPIIVPAAATGNRTAHHVLSAQSSFPDSLRSGLTARRRFWRHVETLRAMGRVNDAEWKQADRRKSVRLVLTPEGVRACGH